jgi:hypothetical protein
MPWERGHLPKDPAIPAGEEIDPKTKTKVCYFFQPVPRCMKCRIQMSYIIPKLEAPDEMDKYRTVNAPMQCAEDIVHAKLRVLNPERIAADAINVPKDELSLADQDKKISNEKELKDPNPESTEAGCALQIMAAGDLGKPALQKLELELGEGVGLMKASMARGRWKIKSEDKWAAMTEKEKEKYNLTLEEAAKDIQSNTEEYKRRQAGVEKARKDVAEADEAKARASKVVYKYLQTLMGRDLTPETEARAGKD